MHVCIAFHCYIPPILYITAPKPMSHFAKHGRHLRQLLMGPGGVIYRWEQQWDGNGRLYMQAHEIENHKIWAYLNFLGLASAMFEEPSPKLTLHN